MIRCTHSLSAIAIALASVLSLNANATSVHGYFHGNEGIAHINNELSVPLLPAPFTSRTPQKLAFAKAQSKTISMNSAPSDQIIPETCEPSEFASYSGNDFVEYVSNAYLYDEVQAGYECFRPIAVKFDEDVTVFSEENINNVAGAIVSEVNSGDYIPERIFGKLFYLRVMYYNYMVQGGSHSVPVDEAKIKESEINAIAFSQSPGLAPCLLEGMKFAKELSKKLGKPLVPLNHCVAHLEIGRSVGAKDPVMLYASGANTQVIAYASGKYRVFGEVLSIALGNALDKFGRAINLGFPAGPKTEELAKKSNNSYLSATK